MGNQERLPGRSGIGALKDVKDKGVLGGQEPQRRQLFSRFLPFAGCKVSCPGLDSTFPGDSESSGRFDLKQVGWSLREGCEAATPSNSAYTASTPPTGPSWLCTNQTWD